MKVCVIGGLGLIGNGVCSVLSHIPGIELCFTYSKTLHINLEKFGSSCHVYFNYRDKNSLNNILELNPDIIINCAGITKHIIGKFNKKDVYLINSDLPIYLDSISKIKNFKFIQVSTDCVFQGSKGNYSEKDTPDAPDLYGHSKLRGEKLLNSLILRTSTIGHEIETNYGLLEWFLGQKKECKGYKNAFFSGITNTELGLIIKEFILPNIIQLKGLYNLSAKKINKYDLLTIFSKFYKKNIKIKTDFDFKIDRSLDSSKFKNALKYEPKSWIEMLTESQKFKNYE
jgi:dTDP-4-dehydrorhamnose reductase